MVVAVGVDMRLQAMRAGVDKEKATEAENAAQAPGGVFIERRFSHAGRRLSHLCGPPTAESAKSAKKACRFRSLNVGLAAGAWPFSKIIHAAVRPC